MFLTSIELFGFKSFAERSRIEFTPGISALLGPNGCGKSNVVDAIKWVLGEQATRSLRAEKMEDVIFNGTEGRKPLNVAEVTLTLANDQGILPIEVSEISIKRRLYRSGESEYFINGTPVKLREIRELFYDTGIGKSSYSIMEQGKIDQVLSNKPEERRLIFEEAAGITKYKIKGQEAERKLERTEENMRQVEGILGEVRRSHDSLKSQSEKTLTFRKLREESFRLELDIQLLRLKSFLEEKDRKDEKLTDFSTRRDTLRGEIDGINESLEENMDIVNSMESKLIESQKKLYGIDLEKHNRESQLRLLAERMGELEGKIASDTAREKTIRSKIASLEDEEREKRQNVDEIGSRIAEVEENIGGFEQSIEAAGSRIGENEQEIARKEAEVRDMEQSREALQRDLRILTDDIVTQLDRRLKESGYSYRERRRLEERFEQVSESLGILLEGKSRLFGDAGTLGEGERPEQLLETARKTLEEAVRGVGEIRTLFASYKDSVPAFIDEFLAPEGTITRKREIDEKIEEVALGIAERRARNDELRQENRSLQQKIDEYRRTLEELRMNRVRMKTRLDAVREALSVLSREREGQQRALEENAREIETGRKRIADIEEQAGRMREERRRLEEEEKVLQEGLASLESGISERNKSLLAKERDLKEKMSELGKIQNRLEQIQMDAAAMNTEIRNLYDNFREKHSRDLTEFESRMYEITVPTRDLRDRLAQVREEQKKLGQVNLMAPEEYAEVKERYDFLQNQLQDLKTAREDLRKVTQEIRTESAELFVSTYNKIKRNFHVMFRRLFGGGRAELRLTDPENVLESGIDILAQPPGKSLENIALLSGGERSLTAVALLFATYMVKPSPFCLLDEIDAALDEQNVGRFVNVLGEFGKSSQFIIITHNKKTVAGAQTLLGVTMEESGVSKIISIRLDNQKEPVHA